MSAVLLGGPARGKRVFRRDAGHLPIVRPASKPIREVHGLVLFQAQQIPEHSRSGKTAF